MSYFRSYLEKNNTIIKNSKLNQAKSPTTEIFYGDGFSRYIFKIDFQPLIEKLNNKEYILTSNTKHILKFYNTVLDDTLGSIKTNGNKRATSFDLIVFKINESWDEGVGFNNEINVNYKPSNWFNKTTLNTWDVQGIYQNPDIITTIHFDNGNEDINIDLTDYVNDVLDNNIVDYGLGIAFTVNFETLPQTTKNSVAFFTKYTQSYFEPYLETEFDDLIIDNRKKFNINKQQTLYLYTKFENESEPINLDELPVVDILNQDNETILSGLTAYQVQNGVYAVDVNINENCDGETFFFDIWKNIKYNNISFDNITQKFIPQKPSISSISDTKNIGQYNLSINGILMSENVKKGGLRVVFVDLYNDLKEKVKNENVFYRLYVEEGKSQVIVHDWTQLNFNDSNYFNLDTTYLIPHDYFIEIKYVMNKNVYIFDKKLKFRVINEK